MSLLTSSIDLDMIAPPSEKHHFNDRKLEALANLFLKSGDTVRPIVLRRISPISFEILEGYFEYYAALKAQEINDQFTAIRAYVVSTEIESTVIEQYRFLNLLSLSGLESDRRSLDTFKSDYIFQEEELIEQIIASNLEQRITFIIESKFESKLNSVLQLSINKLEEKLISIIEKAVEDRIELNFQSHSQKLTNQEINVQPVLLENNASKTKLTRSSKTKNRRVINSDSNKAIGENIYRKSEILNNLNTMSVAELSHKLERIGKGNVKFVDLIAEQRHQQLFASIEDVKARVKGLGDVKMKKIIDSW